MVIKNIHIKNFRAYENFDCEFDDGINLVIGDNGTGKTSLLAAVTQLLSAQVGRFDGGLNLEDTDPHTDFKKVGDATFSSIDNFPVQISGEMKSKKSGEFDCMIIWDSQNSARYEGKVGALGEVMSQEGSVWPLINYQRFDREWKLGKNVGGTIEIETSLNERKDGYKECLMGIGQEDKIQKWCLKMSMLEFERRDIIQEFERFKHIIKVFLQTIEDRKDDFEITYSMSAGLVFKNGNMLQPLYELSTGYKAILSMVMELAYRSVLLNPGVQIDSEEQTGIVIIDEIDVHLHPKWQWNVVDALRKCFPKVQFIIATHSPIVISSAKDAMIISLDAIGQVSYLDSGYGYNVADVLDLKQGSVAVPRESSYFMEKLERALDKGSLDEASNVVLDAKNEFGEKSPVYSELKNYLEINRWMENN